LTYPEDESFKQLPLTATAGILSIMKTGIQKLWTSRSALPDILPGNLSPDI
jgi:hypothetical protein